jgi:threonine dehydratase
MRFFTDSWIPLESYEPIPLEEIEAAQERISDTVFRTPLVKLNYDDAPAEIYLKLENLQPVGAFKIRGASNAMKQLKKEDLKDGVWAASSGNHGQGVAWNARELGVECTILAPETAAKTKIDAIKRMGAEVKHMPFPETPEDWERAQALAGGLNIKSTAPAVIAGNGTIGLEIMEDLPDVDVVLMPVGGGSLSYGVASAIHASKPDVKLYGCEIETSAPLAASFKAGERVDVESIPSFINAIGYPSITPKYWANASRLLNGSLVVSLRETCDSVRLLVECNNVIAEGAGAVSVAAALTGKAGSGKVACVVTGGNIDLHVLMTILQGRIPK